MSVWRRTGRDQEGSWNTQTCEENGTAGIVSLVAPVGREQAYSETNVLVRWHHLAGPSKNPGAAATRASGWLTSQRQELVIVQPALQSGTNVCLERPRFLIHFLFGQATLLSLVHSSRLAAGRTRGAELAKWRLNRSWSASSNPPEAGVTQSRSSGISRQTVRFLPAVPNVTPFSRLRCKHRCASSIATAGQLGPDQSDRRLAPPASRQLQASRGSCKPDFGRQIINRAAIVIHDTIHDCCKADARLPRHRLPLSKDARVTG